MPKSGADIISILRNVTGRVDASDPLFTDTVMLGYVNDFLSLEMPQEVRLYENKTWWEFNIDTSTADPLPVDLEALGYSTLGGMAYIVDTNTTVTPNTVNLFDLWWYQSPSVFYGLWPQQSPNTPQRPEGVLYYNNQLIFRSPPDRQYGVKIQAYKIESTLTGTGSEITSSYFWRYIAYGAALDIFSDYGEVDKYQATMPAFMRYKGLVYARTNQQLQSQRTYPTF
jgi:hypothetical protein